MEHSQYFQTGIFRLFLNGKCKSFITLEYINSKVYINIACLFFLFSEFIPIIYISKSVTNNLNPWKRLIVLNSGVTLRYMVRKEKETIEKKWYLMIKYLKITGRTLSCCYKCSSKKNKDFNHLRYQTMQDKCISK